MTGAPAAGAGDSPAVYADLQVTTNYSFLRGASHPEELFARAALLGYGALAVTDRGSLAGVVQAHEAAKATGLRLVVGCRLDLADGTTVLAYPEDRAAYGRLCRLLTLGKGRAGKGSCDLAWEDLADHGEGLVVALVPDAGGTTGGDPVARDADLLTRRLRRLRRAFGDRAHVTLTRRFRPGDDLRLHHLATLAAAERVATLATNDVLFHAPERRILQDVLTCVREGRTIDALGFRRERSADRFLKPPAEMARLFRRYPDAVARTLEVVARCRFSLSELSYQYPDEARQPGLTPQQALERLAADGAARCYPAGVPDKVAAQLHHELGLIEALGYAPYFLTVHAIIAFARSRGILCQGRGSAANSAVCFVLGITSVDPERSDLLFERFVSAERKEPPDIDVDFESGRREEVIRWVYDAYGRDRAALCAAVVRYRPRSALRDVSKALGLPADVTGALAASAAWGGEGAGEADTRALGLDPSDHRVRLTLDLARELTGFPRHLSQHPGGFVLTRDRLDELVPVEPARMAGRQVVEWDRDDLDALRIMKVDVLGLGMLGALRRAFDLLRERKGIDLDLATVPAEDPATYAMIRKADTVGVFQIESRAQMAMLPRLRPETFYDLVIQVAIVRPGPIQGDMVHPYLRRRESKEPVDLPPGALREVLGRTLGVPLFQEQAMNVAIRCAGFAPGEADLLRRAMASFRVAGGVGGFRERFVAGMIGNGYAPALAERTFRQIEGFGSYGFPESHAASFALLAYASSWLKRHHPDAFLCALLNAQPMGFYAPAQLVRDARAHDVVVRPVDVNASAWDCTLEPAARDGERWHAVRLGLRMVKGLGEREGVRIAAARTAGGPFASVEELRRRAGVPVAALERLAAADAFREGLGLGRRRALWAVRALLRNAAAPLPLFEAAGGEAGAERDGAGPVPEVVEPEEVALALVPAGGEVVEDHAAVGLTLRPHPVAFLRADLARTGIAPASALAGAGDGSRLTVAGLVLVRQRPSSAKGVLFVTVEDETGHANLVVWPELFERERRRLLAARMLACRGRVQRAGEVVHLVAEHLVDLSGLLRRVGERDWPPYPPRGRNGGTSPGGTSPGGRAAAGEAGAAGAEARDRDGLDAYPGPGLRVGTRDFR